MSSDSPVTPPPPSTPSPGPQTQAAPPPPPPVTPAVAAPAAAETKSPALAGLLSMFPGLGHIYLGLYQRAFAFGGAFILLIAFSSHGRGGAFFGPMIGFVWFFAIIDAVRQAKAINRGYVTAGGYAPSPQLHRAADSTASLTWGVILVGIGALWLANRYLDLDRFWDIVENWGGPAAFILLGLVLIITHVKRKRRENESGVGMPPRSG
jgi:hypothetical protein